MYILKKKNNSIKLNIYNKEYNIKNLKLNSRVELENLACAIACCMGIKISQKSIINILSKINNPPGRLQKINYIKKKSIIYIDYAHTPDALKEILKSTKKNNKKPILLFGCGGDRDKIKRELMAKVAKKYSSRVYITDDNPRNESPSKIRKDILKHCPGAIEIGNRKKAINRAISDLKKFESLVIAGKGHEKFQIIKNKKYQFDDLKIVKNIIK